MEQNEQTLAKTLLTTKDFKVGERVEFFWWSESGQCRSWVPGFVKEVGTEIVFVQTSFGIGSADPRDTDESIDEPLIRKLSVQDAQGGESPDASTPPATFGPFTVDDFKVGERVEVYFKQGAELRRWVPATVTGFTRYGEKSFVDVRTQWGSGDVDLSKVFDETRDTIFVRKLTTPERPILDVLEQEVRPLVARVAEICREHDIPFLTVFQSSRQKDGELFSTAGLHRMTCHPHLWCATKLV